jgi:hypothetical protein
MHFCTKCMLTFLYHLFIILSYYLYLILPSFYYLILLSVRFPCFQRAVIELICAFSLPLTSRNTTYLRVFLAFSEP